MYFIEMFADPSDRARFLAILLSAFFVGLGVWYTQRQITNRENKAFKVSKIEELYKTTNEYLHLIENIEKIQAEDSTNLSPFIIGMGVEKKGLVFSEVKSDLLKNHKHLEMLINLYFLDHHYSIYRMKSVKTGDISCVIPIKKAIHQVQITSNSSSILAASLHALRKEALYYVDLTIELSSINNGS